MAPIVEVAAAAGGEVAKCGIVHLEREFGYLIHFRRTVDKLRDLNERLAAAAIDVQTWISAASNKGDEIRESVKDWKRRAGMAQQEATDLIAQAGAVNSWFKGWWCSRFSIGRKAEKKTVVIQALLQENNNMGGTVADPKPFQSFELVAPGDFDAFESRKQTTEEVIRALSNEAIHLVGVHGMPGVGKTMLIQALAKQVKKDNLFDEVVVVIVSQFPKLQEVQGNIARSLGLEFPEGDTDLHKARRLSDRLSQGKKVLIVLDDLWERLELGELGVPFKSNRCKVVFTTRKLDVCHRMETDADVEVKVLSDEDSWALFCKKAAVEGSGISTTIAREIVDKCRGLPLALVTLGLALRKKQNEAIWRDTLTRLKKCIFEGMEPVVSSIKLSFDFLPNEETKICFLLCCLFPEDYHIKTEVLLSYMWGENLFGDVATVSEARDRLLSLLDELTSSNLLVEVEKRVIMFYDEGFIRYMYMMHDVVRDVAIRIASEDDKLGFKVKAGMGLIDWPRIEWTNCKRMSIMGNRLRCNLPSPIKASNLLTLSMRDNSDLEELPSDFFSEMGGLLNLDLSGTAIRSLPSSISCLVNLRTLLVEKCYKLAHVSPIQELEKLEILSFRKSPHFEWPEGICKLRKLKLLNMSGSGRDLSHHLEVISSMHPLEELVMSDTDKVDEDGLYELTESLTHMTSLELDVAYSGKNILLPNLKKLTRFKFCISDRNKYYVLGFGFGVGAKQYQRSVCLGNGIRSKSVENWVRELVENTEFLWVEYCEDIESLDELNRKGFIVLKALKVQGCYRMEFLMDVDVEIMAPKYAFHSLEELRLVNMFSFKTFCKGPLPDGFFSKLRCLYIDACEVLISLVPADLLVRLQKLEVLSVMSCLALKEVIKFEEGDKDPINSFFNFPPSSIFPNLKKLQLYTCRELEYVFPLRVFQDLLQLTELSVVGCAKMKMIFGNDIGEGSNSVVKDRLVLPRLEWLHLKSLRQLSTLSSPGLMIECPALQELIVGRCENLKRLPFDTKSVPKLWKFRAYEEWFNRLEWDDEVTRSLLLKTLVQLKD